VLVTSLNDFPFLVSLSIETACDFMTVLNLFHEITCYLGLQKIYERLALMPAHDYWERKVSIDIQEQMKSMTGCVLKCILSSQAATCSDYFELPVEKRKLNRYRHVYQEISAVLPVTLLPYIVLSKELDSLVERLQAASAAAAIRAEI